MRDGNHRALSFDSLEDRTLLSGNCSADVNGKGDLVIKCDNENTHLSIEGYGDDYGDGYIEIEGHDGTTVNGQESIQIDGLTRDLKMKAGGGDDYIYLYKVDVPRNLKFNGGKGIDYLAGRYDTSTVGGQARIKVEDEGIIGQGDAMARKLNEAIGQLQRSGLPHGVYHQAIDQVVESIFTSNLVILPTPDPNPQDPDPQFDRFNQDVERAVQALNEHVNGQGGKKTPLGTPESKGEAAALKNFLELTREALQMIGAQTDFCDPNTLSGPGCELLQQDDEGGNVVDQVLGQLFHRQVRSPFPFLINSSLQPNEQIIPTDSLADGECAAVIKEIQGIKLVVTARVIPIWVEPWFARASIVGFRSVWVAEFVPAEHIKTISVCNDEGSITTTVDTQVVLERQLLHFWRFLRKDITAVA